MYLGFTIQLIFKYIQWNTYFKGLKDPVDMYVLTPAIGLGKFLLNFCVCDEYYPTFIYISEPHGILEQL